MQFPAAQLADKSWDAAETCEQMQKADLFYIGVAITEIVCCVFAIALISKITIAQEKSSKWALKPEMPSEIDALTDAGGGVGLEK